MSSFPFFSFPKELRLRILFFTDLVARPSRPGKPIHFLLNGTKIKPRLTDHSRLCCNKCAPAGIPCRCRLVPISTWTDSSTCTCFCFPAQFFLVSRTFASEARQIFFLHNRLVLEHPPDRILETLLRLPWGELCFIREISLVLWAEYWNEFHQEDWCDEILPFIAEKFNIPRLALSIDAGEVSVEYVEQQVPEESLKKDREAYKLIVGAMERYGRFGQLRSFFCFWATGNENEAEAEKRVMGDTYDSVKDGKIPFAERDASMPWRSAVRERQARLVRSDRA